LWLELIKEGASSLLFFVLEEVRDVGLKM